MLVSNQVKKFLIRTYVLVARFVFNLWHACLFVLLLPIWSISSSADESFWTELSNGKARSALIDRAVPLPSSYRAFQVDLVSLNQALDALNGARSASLTISLPHPNGGFEAFQISPSGVMSPELSAKFPEIRTFKGRSQSDLRTTLQLATRGHAPRCDRPSTGYWRSLDDRPAR